jgi:Pumilio-family RNA binding repeat
VVEKCLQFGSEKDRKDIIDEFLESHNYDLSEEIMSLGGPQLNGALYTMMKDRYGNYVIQKCIEVSKGKQREILVKKITACANVLRKQANYSRHVYNFIEKMSSEGGGGVSLGLGITPSAAAEASQGFQIRGDQSYDGGYNQGSGYEQHHYVQKRQGNNNGGGKRRM